MPSPYWVMIRLEPHYQRFLRSQFRCEAEVFEFPPRHVFNTMLEHMVVTRIDGQVPDPGDKKEELFKIAIPEMNWKNPAHFRYLSKTKEIILRKKIKDYYDFVIGERIATLMKIEKMENGHVKYDRQECTQQIIDEYKFDMDGDTDSFDRLYKLFTRYKQKEKNRRYYFKKEGKEKGDGEQCDQG